MVTVSSEQGQTPEQRCEEELTFPFATDYTKSANTSPPLLTPHNTRTMPAATTLTAATVSTRLATLSDVERLHAIIHTAYCSEKNWTNQSALVQGERIKVPELREQIQTQLDPVLVAEIDGQVTGCIQLEFCRDHPSYELSDDAVLIGLLAVDSDFQSQGVGKTLFAAAIEFAKSVGKCRRGMMFVINQRADIQAWYERLGFAWNGDRREFGFPDRALQDIWFKVYEKEL